MIKVVLFDLDGTLLNRPSSLIKFVESQYERMHACLSHIPKEDYVDRFIKLDSRGYVWKDKVYGQLIEEFSIRKLTQNDLLDDYLINFKNHCIAFPNLKQILFELKSSNYKLGMISNGSGQFQMDNIKALGILDFFELILISENEGISKPNPMIFQKALDYFQVSAKETVYIGDHPDNDYIAARNL